MGWDEVVENISFGRTLPHLNSCLGLYLSTDTLFLAEVHKGDRPEVDHLIRLPIPPGPPSKETKTVGALNTDFLSDTERVVGLLRKAMEEIRWRSKDLVVTLANDLGILRYFTLPAIDRRFWKTAVPSEAKKYIPISFSSLVYDYQIVPLAPSADRRGRLGSLFGVTDQKNMENIRRIVQRLGLNLVGVELAPCSVERLWDSIEGLPSYAHVHFDGGQIRIVISEGGIPIFSREVFLGPEVSLVERRKVDLAGCIDFAKKQLGSKGPARVRLSGQAPNLAQWQEAFAQELGMPVTLQQVDQTLGLRGGQWGAYAAIGCALRYLSDTPLVVDISSLGKISEEDRRTASTILAASLVLSTFFVLVGGWRQGMTMWETGKLRQLNQKGMEVLDSFRGKTISDIERTMKVMRTKASAFNTLISAQTPLTHIFEALAETIPDAVWLTGITYDNPVSLGNASDPRMMTLLGKTLSSSTGAEQDLAVQFAENLRKDERFGGTFPSVQPSVELPADAGMAPGGPGAGIKAAVPEARTKFTIRCSSLRKGS